MTTIAVLGSGKIGGNLARKWAAHEQLISEIGSRPIRVGDADSVDVVDGVLRLWFALVRQGQVRHIGLRFLED